MLQFISNYNTSPVLVFSFNTSHVVVYHVTDYQNTPVGVLFQYISCCSLSCGSQKCILSILVSIHLMLQFIQEQTPVPQPHQGFNTSHVVVYRIVLRFSLVSQKCFNTSHVVVYLNHRIFYGCRWQFQYISCCSLSDKPDHSQHHNSVVSIHLMLQFIQNLHK